MHNDQINEAILRHEAEVKRRDNEAKRDGMLASIIGAVLAWPIMALVLWGMTLASPDALEGKSATFGFVILAIAFVAIRQASIPFIRQRRA